MRRRPKKLLDQVREKMSVKHNPSRTEEAYVNWVRDYIQFHNKRCPKNKSTHENRSVSNYWPNPSYSH